MGRRWTPHEAERPSAPEVGHAWRPLHPLTPAELAYDFRDVDEWKARWDAFRRQPTVQAQLQTGVRRLERYWSIETGVIEGLYTLNRGTATTLLEHGFATEWVRRQDTNIEPELLIAMLQDHQASVELVHGYIREERLLSAHAMRELHACITAHQATHDAVDSLGQRVQRPLRRGVFKQYPNNPTRPDGKVHCYCPPEQVDSEIQRLLDLYELYDNAHIHPLLCAAWLHHRFIQIHPFADGNGRVVRALMNWHLIKREFLPIAVAQHERVPYIYALEQADAGDLEYLVTFLRRLSRHMVHMVVRNGEQSMAILGSPGSPEDYIRDDYAGWRK